MCVHKTEISLLSVLDFPVREYGIFIWPLPVAQVTDLRFEYMGHSVANLAVEVIMRHDSSCGSSIDRKTYSSDNGKAINQ